MARAIAAAGARLHGAVRRDGIALAIIGYKLFDRCTPGHLHKEIIENRNVAAAIIGGSVILGVCIIIAAAMLG